MTSGEGTHADKTLFPTQGATSQPPEECRPEDSVDAVNRVCLISLLDESWS